jgi:hypothetical protein
MTPLLADDWLAPVRQALVAVTTLLLLTGCGNTEQAASAATVEDARLRSAVNTQPTACDLVTAAEMSAILDT